MTLSEPRVSFLTVLSTVQMQSSCLTSQPRFEITKPKFWLKKKDRQELTYRTDPSFRGDGPGAGPLVDLCHDFEGHRQQRRGVHVLGELPLSGIFPEERELGGSPPWDTHMHLPLLVGSWESPWGPMLSPRNGDRRKGREMGLRWMSRVALTHRGLKQSEA